MFQKDVSVEANLFLWTSIALVVILVGGIQLMFGIGNDPLPGVLDAATIPKRVICKITNQQQKCRLYTFLFCIHLNLVINKKELKHYLIMEDI